MNNAVNFIYLHGFNSSPNSEKATLLASYLSRLGHNIYAPFLPPVPGIIGKELYRLIDQQTANETILVGSSLGAFYAIHLAERYNLKAVLINPAITPWRSIKRYIGPCFCAFSQTTYEITSEYAMLLQDLAVEHISKPENFLLLLQTGDELLDYREALEKFPSSLHYIEQGGNHRFENFELSIPRILEFALGTITPHPHPLPQGERGF